MYLKKNLPRPNIKNTYSSSYTCSTVLRLFFFFLTLDHHVDFVARLSQACLYIPRALYVSDTRSIQLFCWVITHMPSQTDKYTHNFHNCLVFSSCFRKSNFSFVNSSNRHWSRKQLCSWGCCVRRGNEADGSESKPVPTAVTSGVWEIVV